MRRVMIALLGAVLGLCFVVPSAAVNGNLDSWNISIKYADDDSNLMGQSSSESGEPCTFMVYFGKGRQGIRTGFDPDDNPFAPWQRDADAYTRRRSRSKEPITAMPDIMVVFTVVVEPLSNRRLNVQLITNRWELVDEPPPYDYRFETRSEEQEVQVGDDWSFLAGTGPDGKDYYLHLTIRSASSGSGTGTNTRTRVKARSQVRPLKLKYRLLTPDAEGQTEFQTVRTVQLTDSDNADGIEIQAPISVPGVDSSLLNVSFKFNQVMLQNTGTRGQYNINAVFEMERWLLVDIQPSPTTAQMVLSHMISSSYSHGVQLRPNKKVRIELPKIESGGYDLNAREIIEIETGGEDD